MQSHESKRECKCKNWQTISALLDSTLKFCCIFSFRAFSIYNYLKTKLRVSLLDENADAQMRLCYTSDTTQTIDATKMTRAWLSSNHRRCDHPSGWQKKFQAAMENPTATQSPNPIIPRFPSYPFEIDHAYVNPSNPVPIKKPEGMPCFAIVNKKHGVALTRISDTTTALRLTFFNSKKDQIWFWSGMHIVSLEDGRVIQGSEGESEVSLGLAQGKNYQKWSRRRGSNFYESYLISEHQNYYLGPIERPNEEDVTSWAVGLFKGRRNSRPFSSIWLLDPVNCYTGVDISIPREPYNK